MKFLLSSIVVLPLIAEESCKTCMDVSRLSEVCPSVGYIFFVILSYLSNFHRYFRLIEGCKKSGQSNLRQNYTCVLCRMTFY